VSVVVPPPISGRVSTFAIFGSSLSTPLTFFLTLFPTLFPFFLPLLVTLTLFLSSSFSCRSVFLPPLQLLFFANLLFQFPLLLLNVSELLPHSLAFGAPRSGIGSVCFVGFGAYAVFLSCSLFPDFRASKFPNALFDRR
jgi:hypothetical protein